MKFNLKYLILPLSIICCINTYNTNAMEDINEDKNPNKIIENDKNNNKFQIQNQSNNNSLKVDINKENDIEQINQLITEEITSIPAVKFLIKNITNTENNGTSNKGFYNRTMLYSASHYKDSQILNLMHSFNNSEPNKPLTINQLIRINDIIKTVYFFIQKDKEYKRQGISFDYDFEFAISDREFGIGLSHDDEGNSFGDCLFIQPSNCHLFAMKNNYRNAKRYKSANEHNITNKSFRNFLDAVKLCSYKRLPNIFKDKNGNNPYLITKDEHKTFLTTLMKDFWISFYGEYIDTLYEISKSKARIKSKEEMDIEFEIEKKSIEEYEKLKNQYNKLINKVDNLRDEVDKLESEFNKLPINNPYKHDEVMKTIQYKTYKEAKQKLYKTIYLLNCYECKPIADAFEDNYDEKNFIEIFGKETVNNIRYIIDHLIDLEIDSNYKLFQNTLDRILSKEKNLYETMRRSTNEGKKLIDKCIQELEKVFNLEQKVWTDNIFWTRSKYYDNMFKQLGDNSEIELSDDNYDFNEDDIELEEYRLNSKKRVEDYLKKLLYDKMLRNKVFKYIMDSNYLYEDMRNDNVLNTKEKNFIGYLNDIKSIYIFKNILKYITSSKQRDLFFGSKKQNSNFGNNENVILNEINDNYNNKLEKNKKGSNKNNIILNKKRTRISDVNNNEINNNFEESEKNINKNNDSSDDEGDNVI